MAADRTYLEHVLIFKRRLKQNDLDILELIGLQFMRFFINVYIQILHLKTIFLNKILYKTF